MTSCTCTTTSADGCQTAAHDSVRQAELVASDVGLAVGFLTTSGDDSRSKRLLLSALGRLNGIIDSSVDAFNHASVLGEYISRLTSEIDRKNAALNEEQGDARLSDPVIRNRVYELTGGECIYCGQSLDLHSFHVEHVVPKSKGGPDSFENFVPSCKACNLSKSTGHVVSFIYRLNKQQSHLRVVSDGDAA